MPVREPIRSSYIFELYNKKNLKWLLQEKKTVERIINWYTNEIEKLVTEWERENVRKDIEYERSIMEKIDRYISRLLVENLSNK